MRNDLIQAYIGILEDNRELKTEYDKMIARDQELGAIAVEGWESWLRTKCIALINEATRRERLETYLEWNGIIGFTTAIFEIATSD